MIKQLLKLKRKEKKKKKFVVLMKIIFVNVVWDI